MSLFDQAVEAELQKLADYLQLSDREMGFLFFCAMQNVPGYPEDTEVQELTESLREVAFEGYGVGYNLFDLLETNLGTQGVWFYLECVGLNAAGELLPGNPEDENDPLNYESDLEPARKRFAAVFTRKPSLALQVREAREDDAETEKQLNN
jgi:hypothetical protein